MKYREYFEKNNTGYLDVMSEFDRWKKSTQTKLGFASATSALCLTDFLEDERIEDTDKLLQHTPIFDVISGKEIAPGFRPVKIKSKDWVTVIVKKQNGNYIMVRQLRYGTMQKYIEFPCGMVDECDSVYNDDGILMKVASARRAAVRELEEETGYRVNSRDLVFLGSYAANPAFMTNYMHYFYIDLNGVNYDIGKQHLDEHEKLNVVEKSWDGVVMATGDECSVLMRTAMALLTDHYVMN